MAHEASSKSQELEELKRKVQLYKSDTMKPLVSYSKTLFPFFLEVRDHEMAKSVKIPKKRCNKTMNPYDHVEEFDQEDGFSISNGSKKAEVVLPSLSYYSPL